MIITSADLPSREVPSVCRVDPFALPCHPQLRVDGNDRDWRAVGVKTTDGVRRKSTRCPECKTTWTAFERIFAGEQTTVEWVQSQPFRVRAMPMGGIRWQDLEAVAVAGPLAQPHNAPTPAPAPAPEDWTDAVQEVSFVQSVTAGGLVFAEPGEQLVERRARWNPQDRRLALLWSPRLGAPVVAWHSFARLPQRG